MPEVTMQTARVAIKVLRKQLGIITTAIFLLSFQLPSKALTYFATVHQPISDVSWTLDATVSGVIFYHSIVECNGKNVVFLKLDNKNAFSTKVTWKEVFTTQEGPEIEGYSGTKNIEIGPGETSETNCNNPAHPQLVILGQQVKPTYVANISKFSYKAINVSKIN